MHNTDPDVLEPGINKILIVRRAGDESLEQFLEVVHPVYADVLSQHGPLGGDPGRHVGAVGQLIVGGHAGGPGPSPGGQLRVDGESGESGVGSDLINQLNEVLLIFHRACGSRTGGKRSSGQEDK